VASIPCSSTAVISCFSPRFNAGSLMVVVKPPFFTSGLAAMMLSTRIFALFSSCVKPWPLIVIVCPGDPWFGVISRLGLLVIL